MLTGSLLLSRTVQNRIEPAFLDPRNPGLLDHCARMIERVRHLSLLGEPVRRRELREELEPLFHGPGNQKIWEGISSILEKRCGFQVDAKGSHEEFRLAVFEKAALARAAGWFERKPILEESAAEAGFELGEAEERLFGDLVQEQTMTAFEAISPERLLHLYNIGLVQGILLQSMAIQAEADHPSAAELRALANRLRFHRLIGKFRKSPDGRLRLSVDGPMSIFGQAHRYGFQLACFFPALLDLQNLSIRARLAWGKRKTAKVLAHDQGDQAHGLRLIWPESRAVQNNPAAEDLLALFSLKESKENKEDNKDKRDRKNRLWSLVGCTEVRPRGTHYWIPDLELCRLTDRKKVYIELPGAWRQGDIAAYLAQQEKKGMPRSILCLKESFCLGSAQEVAEHPALYLYRKTPLLAEIFKRAEALLSSDDRPKIN